VLGVEAVDMAVSVVALVVDGFLPVVLEEDVHSALA
jgi:hypothetical protein